MSQFNGVVKFVFMEGAMAYWLVRWSLNQMVRVRALAGTLCCILGQDTFLS